MSQPEVGDASPSTSELMGAITELTAAVRALTAAIETGRSVAPAPAPGPGEGAGAPETHWPRRSAAGSGPAPGSAPASSRPAGPASTQSPLEAMREVVTGIFAVAAAPDGDEVAFEEFIRLNHSERTSAPRAVPSLREFAWRQLRKRRHEYLKDVADAGTFTINRTDPTKIDDKTLTVRLFLVSSGRSPTPITLKRDPAVDGAWRITDSSL